MGQPKFYITTAIDYPNGAPHMGHAYEKLVTDTYARWYRFMGYDTFFLTGTDENGQKLSKAAEDQKTDTRSFVDSQVLHFKKLCDDLEISHDDFIRTTEDRHKEVCQDLWSKMEKKGDIYFGRYEGWYCLSCEAFYTKLQAPDQKCPVHFVPLNHVEEDGYFFKLSKYQTWIVEHFKKHSKFLVPESARKEMLFRIEEGEIKDLSISRPNAGWGIPIPGNEKFVMYTWFDALINYYTAARKGSKNERFWPAQMHVIGKDISWFHSVIWPCMLESAGLAIPEQIYVHGMVLGQDGRKMSKSLGNGVDPYEVLQKFPRESFRYYILRAIPSGLDGAFVLADLVSRHNSELANDFGNLVMRTVKLSLKKLGSEISLEGVKAAFDGESLLRNVQSSMEAREHHRALEVLWSEINAVNLYLTKEEPWRKEGADPKFREIMGNALYAIHVVSALLQSFMPEVAKKTLEVLGTQSLASTEGFKFGVQKFKLIEPQPLFPKIETA